MLQARRMTRGVRCVLIFFVGFPYGVAAASENENYEIDIPISRAKKGLGELARQTGTPLLYSSREIENKIVSGVKGEYTLEEALEIMLRGTGLQASVNASGVLIVSVQDNNNASTNTGDEMGKGAVMSKQEALFAGASAAVGALQASPREQSAGVSSVSSIEEVSVTGTRIGRPGMVSPVPVMAISSDELNNIAPGNLSQALQDIPQFLNNSIAQNRGTFLGAAGQAFLNIRGMGAPRTLVLLNGRRVAPSDRQSSVDVNLFPDAMISRVDIVTGGASAAYGADALAGVANLIVDTQYTGFRGSVQGGQTNHRDGDNWEV
ncbi:MAG: TonB-dependent receptor, partial [Azoarcus sp.]|nr:TonB-dependent receptor [Azoarcus sp.]